jgi:hypothetical protein
MTLLSKRKTVQLPEDIYWHLSGYALMHGHLGLGEAVEHALNLAEIHDTQPSVYRLNDIVDEALIGYINRLKGKSLHDFSVQITEDGIIHPTDIRIRRDIIIHRLRALLKESEIDQDALKKQIGDDIKFVLVNER